MTQTVTYRKIAGATTEGQYIWIAEIETNGWLVARGEFETAAEAWNWIYNF